MIHCLFCASRTSTVGKIDSIPAEQWVLVLDLATRWQFDAVRDVALEQLMSGLNHDSHTLALQLAAAHQHAHVEYYWRVFTLLCERGAPLSPEEGEQLGVREAVHISATREKLRGAKGRAIFESMKRIKLTEDQQRMIRSELGISPSMKLGKPALDLYQPVYVVGEVLIPRRPSVYE